MAFWVLLQLFKVDLVEVEAQPNMEVVGEEDTPEEEEGGYLTAAALTYSSEQAEDRFR
jgi:hypothetical protein